MPSLDAEDVTRIDRALQSWRQGDVALDDSVFFLHLADLGTPLTTEARETANAHTDSGEGGSVEGVASVVPGVVLVTQTCDIVRSCAERPYVEVSPLIEVPRAFLDDVRRLRRPAFAHVPAVETRGLVADLDRTMTVEKRWLLLGNGHRVGQQTPNPALSRMHFHGNEHALPFRTTSSPPLGDYKTTSSDNTIVRIVKAPTSDHFARFAFGQLHRGITQP